MPNEAANSKKTAPQLEKFQWKPGQSGNPSGRPKGTLKDYVRQMFMEMTPEEKKQWIKENNITGIDQWKMGEGNPAQEQEVKGELNVKVVKFDEPDHPPQLQP